MDMITYDNPQSMCILGDALIMNAWHLRRVTDDAMMKTVPKTQLSAGLPSGNST